MRANCESRDLLVYHRPSVVDCTPQFVLVVLGFSLILDPLVDYPYLANLIVIQKTDTSLLLVFRLLHIWGRGTCEGDCQLQLMTLNVFLNW